MVWNWQQDNWPEFSYDAEKLIQIEQSFLLQSGQFFGAYKHISNDERQTLIIDFICDEALKTSEIEGEYLNRDSVQSSIRQQFGLSGTSPANPSERGIAEMMVNLYEEFDAVLTHDLLFKWHSMLLSGHQYIKEVGRYRTHVEPMQVVSGPVHKPKVHFEAPPSKSMKAEMNGFINWFNSTAPDGKSPMPALTRAAITHLYFVSIHPFEDGNGRIGRALSEKALAQAIRQPTLIALARTIEARKKLYYDMLEVSNKKLAITPWLEYFADTILQAQKNSEELLDFLLAKTKLFDQLRGKINHRQEKALLRMFKEGADGFQGGMSAKNYIAITNTTRATTTRDLQELVDLGALKKTGELKSTRYWLKLI